MHRPSCSSRIFVALFASVVLTACPGSKKNTENAAREELSKTYSCPAESVTVTSRPELDAYDLTVTPQAPPAEVAADPARLAEWKRRESKTREGYTNMSVVHASGCGHAVFYICSLGNRSNGEQVMVCSTAQHPPG